MPRIFISYRRDDTAGHAGRLYDGLTIRFGKNRVFMDLEIEAGLNFEEVIRNEVASCDVCLVLIGRQWLSVSHGDGHRRLDDPNDWTRLEIAAAVERDIRVIPVLVQGARMPTAEQLPERLRELATRNALEISEVRWEYDVGRLCDIIAKTLQKASARERQSGSEGDGQLLSDVPTIDCSEQLAGDLTAELPLTVDGAAAKATVWRESAGGPTVAELHDPKERARPSEKSRARVNLAPPRFAWIAAGLIGAVAAGGVASSLLRRSSSGVISSPVLAVLPLSNLSGDSAHDYLGAGIAESLTTSFASMPTVTVVSAAAIRDALQRSRDTRRVARDVAASYLVEGGVQEAGGRLRITLRVLRPDASVLWGDTFEGAGAEIFDLQTRIAAAMIIALDVTVHGYEPAQGIPLTRDPAALDDYWRGRALLDRRDVNGNPAAAVAAFERAAARDPRFALAQAALGEAYWEMYSMTRLPVWTGKATEAATRALRLDSSSPEVRYSVALTYAGVGRQADALDELRRALTIRPRYEDARRLLGEVLAAQGKIDEAVAEFRKIVAARPNYAAPHGSIGIVLLRAGRVREAIAAFAEAVRLQPDNAAMHQRLGTAYHQDGQLDRAVQSYERAVAIQPVAQVYSNLGVLHHSRGEYAQAVKSYERAIELRPNSAATHRNVGDAYLRLGARDTAHRAYARAVELASADVAVNPSDALTRSMLAVYEAKAGDAEAALRDAATAAASAPSDPQVIYRQAVTYLLCNRPEDAVRALEAAITLGYSRSQALQDDDLATLRTRPEVMTLLSGPPVTPVGRRE
jgi:tetratricopeptide (TPR) repeat protein